MAKKRHHKPPRHIYNSTPNKSLNHFPTPPNPTSTVDTATNWLLSGCKSPRTLSSDAISSHSLRADVDAGAADVDDMTYSYGPTDESPRLTDPSPGSVRASSRFFVAPAATGSLIEEARRLSGATAAAAADVLVMSGSTPAELVMRRVDNEVIRGELPMTDGRNKVYKSFSDVAAAAAASQYCGGVAAVAYSDDPRADFRASMMEMVAAACHVESGEPLDDDCYYWGFMEELLFCYLQLNERSVYKYIFRAFADVAKNRSPEHRRRIPVDDVD